MQAPNDLAHAAFADTVFRVGRAYGMTADRGIYESLAVTDGRITAVGRSRDELDSFTGPGTAVIDDPELVLYPAFNDTHNHQLLAARDLDYVSLEQAGSVEELVRALREAADRTPRGARTTTSGGQVERHASWTRRAPGHPVFVQRGGHVGVANSVACISQASPRRRRTRRRARSCGSATGPRPGCSSRLVRLTRCGGAPPVTQASRLSCSRGSAGATTAAASASSVTQG